MPAWAWIIVAVIVVGLIAIAVWWATSKRRSQRLRAGFGPEYERVVTERGDRRAAESELKRRQERREQLDIRPLSEGSRERYTERWQQVEARFVDSPALAVSEGDRLVIEVMGERGYPMENFDQRSADISVDHPRVVDNYRAAHAISMANDHDKASTEDLRQAMIHYRQLVEELLGPTAGVVDTGTGARQPLAGTGTEGGG
jgi:hypothetical protein